MTRPRTRIDPDQRREALVDAALECLREHGKEGASVRRISARAGVSIGLINHYFPGKASLIAAAYKRLASELLLTYQDDRRGAVQSPRQRLRHFFKSWFAPAMFEPDLLRVWLVFWSGAIDDAEVRNTYKVLYVQHRRALEKLLAGWAAEEQIRRFDVKRASLGLLGLMDGLWLQLSLDSRALSATHAVQACEDWLRSFAR